MSGVPFSFTPCCVSNGLANLNQYDAYKRKLQISRLENELSQLKEGTGGADADNVMLQHMLDDTTKAKDKLEQEYLQAHTGKLILEAQLAAINGGSSIEGSVVLFDIVLQALRTD